MTMASLRLLCHRPHVALIRGISHDVLARTGPTISEPVFLSSVHSFKSNGKRGFSMLKDITNSGKKRMSISFRYREALCLLEKRYYSTTNEDRKLDSSKASEKKPIESPIARTSVKAGIQRMKALASLTPHENIYTVPNILTFTRLIAAPVIGYLVLHDYHAWALGLFAYAGITDLVDGYIARRWNLQTVVGTVIDPMADKLLMTVLTICLAAKAALPIWLAVIILGRDVGLAISAIYYRYISLPPPKTFARYWDFSLPSAEVHPTTISKYNTALQLALIGATTAMPLIPAGTGIEVAMPAFQYLVAATTVWSGASYIYSKDAVKILNQEDIKEKSQEKDGEPKK